VSSPRVSGKEAAFCSFPQLEKCAFSGLVSSQIESSNLSLSFPPATIYPWAQVKSIKVQLPDKPCILLQHPI